MSTALVPAPGRRRMEMVQHTLTGELSQVRNVLRSHQANGTLVARGEVRPNPAGSGVVVCITVLEPASLGKPLRAVRWSPQRAAAGIAAGTVVAVLGALAYIVVTTLAWVLAHLAVILLAVGAVVVVGGVGGCTTIVKITHRH